MLSFRFFRFLAVIAAFIPLVLFYTGSCRSRGNRDGCARGNYDACPGVYPSMVYREDMVECPSRKHPPKSLFVWLHGTTQNGGSVESLATEIRQQFPDCHIIAPHGRHGYDGAYFDFKQFSESEIVQQLRVNRRQFVSLQCIIPLMEGMRDKPDISLAEARNLYEQNDASLKELRGLVEIEGEVLMKIIEEKQKELGLKNEHTIIAGFSQGGFLGLHLALTQKEPFLCMINFSGSFVEPKQYNNTSTPILFIHGERDNYVTPRAPELAKETLKRKGIEPDSRMLLGIGHGYNERGIQYAINFIKEQKLKQDPAAAKTDAGNQLSDADLQEIERWRKERRIS